MCDSNYDYPEPSMSTPDMNSTYDEWEEFRQQQIRENQAWLEHLNSVHEEICEELPF